MTRSAMKRLLALPSAIRTAVWFTILTVPAAVAAYYRIFSGFAEWDDEGTLMMTVRQYLTGARLYEEIYSGYGPVYYFYNWLVRSATGNVLNHNAVRITSAVVSLLCALICAWIVLRLTKSLAAASVAHLLVFRVLSFFTNEPGHPQELCMLLLVCLAGSGILAANPRYVWLAMTAAGSIAAALTLVKVNIGIFAILAVALAVLFQSPPGWFWRTAKYAAGGGALLLPFALMRVHLNDPAAQAYCFVVTASIAGVLAGAPGFARAGTLSFRECLAAAAGFAVTLALVLLVLVWQGVPMQATLKMLVLNHVRINVSQGFWYRAVELGRIWIAWAMAGLGAAILVVRAAQSREKSVYGLLTSFRILFGAAGLLMALVSPNLLLGFVTPFCWLLLCPRADHAPLRQTHARILLCIAAVLQTLYAYPIAGSQTYFLRVLLVLVAAISLLDGTALLTPVGQVRADGPKIRPARGRRHSGRGSTGLPGARLPGQTALRVTHAAGYAGGGANSCGEGRSGGLPMAGGPLAAKLRHLRGPAGNTEPLFLDRQTAAWPAASAARPAEFRMPGWTFSSRPTAGDRGGLFPAPQRLRGLPPQWRRFLEHGQPRCPGMAPGELHPDSLQDDRPDGRLPVHDPQRAATRCREEVGG